MIASQKIKHNWLDFGLNYLGIAELGCKEMQKTDSDLKIPDLYISTVYNIKHGIEVLLKSIIVILEDKELIKKDEIHNQKMLFEKICSISNLPDVKTVIRKLSKEKEGDENWIFINERFEKIDSQFLTMHNLIYKYQHLIFLKDKIKEDFVIEDIDNTTFRYPQNSFKIKLDYREILERISISDIINLKKDINKLTAIFISLFFVFSEYKNNKLPRA